MIKNIQLILPSGIGEGGEDYLLSITQVTHEVQADYQGSFRDYITHEIGLCVLSNTEEGYVLVNEPIFIYDIQELYDIIHDAYDGELSIFLNQYHVELDVDNDNQPMLDLVVNNEDNTST